MQYCYMIVPLARGQFELRFPDFVGARELVTQLEHGFTWRNSRRK